MVSNYSYEQINFNHSKREIEGKMYHVTGQDGSKRDGDEGAVFIILPKKKKLIVPLLIKDDLKGLFISQQYDIGKNYHESILIGNRHSLIGMPQFRGRGHSFSPPLMCPA